MASTRNRQRALARAKLERQMARRAASARKRRQALAIVGIVAAVIVVAGGAGLLVWANSGKDDGGNKKSAHPAASAKPAADTCYTKAQANGNPNLKDVGTPKEADVVKTGTQNMSINTNVGTIGVKLDTAKAPCNVHSFTYLADKKFFDKSTCHRMTTKQAGLEVLQCGDPSGTGSGGPNYTVKDENLPTGKKPTYPAGTVAVANTGQPGSGSSQFFIVYGDTNLPASYSVIGTVDKGLDVVQDVAKKGVKPADPSKPGDGAPKQKVNVKTLRVSAPAGGKASSSPKADSKS
ncbi:MAG: peptidylprolyl isomerase [Actinocatenispora sp.]